MSVENAAIAAPVAPGAPSPTSAEISSDAADMAQAMAILSAPEKAEAVAPAETPKTEEPKAPEAAPAPKAEPDVDTKAILARMARLEHEAEQAKEEAAQLRAGKDSASKWAKVQELKASRNFQAVLTELGVTADELQSMVLEGNKPLDPETVQLKKQTAELAEFKAQLERNAQAQSVAAAQAQFKTKELAPLLTADKYPLSRAVYGEGVVEEVFAVLQHKYNSGDKNPSVSEAAKIVEDFIAGIVSKASPVAPSLTESPTAKSTPGSVTLTNAPTTSPTSPDLDTEEGRYQAALKLLKGN